MLFVRYPEKGKVKSRLSHHLGDDTASHLYRHFIEDILDTLSKGNDPLHIVYHPGDKKREIVHLLGSRYSYFSQEGHDLGARMKNAFLQCFSDDSHETAILMGSDIPDLPLEIVEEALQSLTVHDAVLGPACDGGYYLIGFRRNTFCASVFHRMAWGTDTVFRDTMGTLLRNGYTVYTLPVWRDIDDAEGLRDLIVRSNNTGFTESKTMAYLREIGFVKHHL